MFPLIPSKTNLQPVEGGVVPVKHALETFKQTNKQINKSQTQYWKWRCAENLHYKCKFSWAMSFYNHEGEWHGHKEMGNYSAVTEFFLVGLSQYPALQFCLFMLCLIRYMIIFLEIASSLPSEYWILASTLPCTSSLGTSHSRHLLHVIIHPPNAH